MKKFFLPFLALLLFNACEKEDFKGSANDNLSIEARAPAPKIDVCHYDAENQTWHVINISENAWAAHEKHGDVRLDDQDNDGYVPDNACDFGIQGDCDDNDPDVNPERCRQTGEPGDCIISDLQILSITCIDDESYRICFEAFTVNVPQTPADLEITIDGQLFTLGELSGLGLTANGFFGCVDLPANGLTDRHVFISVDEEGVCCFCEADFWDDPDCDDIAPTAPRPLEKLEYSHATDSWLNK